MAIAKKPKILLVDDDEFMCSVLTTGLERDGYEVTAVGSAHELMNMLPKMLPDSILLDLVLPDSNGLNLIATIREHTAAPVIVVSSKNELVDKVVGLEMGADDYISKPFEIKELSARLKAHVRRYQGGASQHEEKKAIRFGPWTMDRDQLQVLGENGKNAGLSIKEFRLLEVLLLSHNRVLSREQLLDLSRASDFNVTDRAIDTQITRIRKKLNDEDAANGMIRTVRGIGYMLFLPEAH
jgi:DNA-binding response OmpR family regulator